MMDYYLKYQISESKKPIFYNRNYNLTLIGFERLHPFDFSKYKRVYKTLLKNDILSASEIISPKMINHEVLAAFHTQRYIKSLKDTKELANILEVPPVAKAPYWLLKRLILNPFLYATSGTIMASMAAIQRGWAINLGGGFHHASLDQGGGFCPYADITIAIKLVQKRYKQIKKVLYVDLDAHQGDGPGRDFLGDDSVIILDSYNHQVFPDDVRAKEAIEYKLERGQGETDETWLPSIKENLERSVKEHKIDFIFYNAGTDIMAGDPLGQWCISEEGVLKRDEMVFELATTHKIPIVMVLSGGYQKSNAPVIAKSITQITQKYSLY